MGSFDEGNVAIGVAVMVGLGSLSAGISTGDVFKDVRSTQVSVGFALRFCGGGRVGFNPPSHQAAGQPPPNNFR